MHILFLLVIIIKPFGKRPLERPKSTRNENIRIDLKEIGVNTRNCIDFAPNRDYWRARVNVRLNLGFHKPWSCSINIFFK